MRLPRLLLLASISAGLTAATAETARRPRYGGTLHVEIGAAVATLDLSAPATDPEEARAKHQIEALVSDPPESASAYGPFRVVTWEAGKRAVLAANEDYPGGRPFMDAIEIQMGRPVRERLLDLEVGKADLVDLPPELARREAERGVRVSVSHPDELLALVFLKGRPTADARVREAVARSIDRTGIVSFLFQKEGEPAGALLPQWSSGTAFLFPTASDVERARKLASQMASPARIVLGYDANDSVEKPLAERIALNAREAGISISAQGVSSATAAPKTLDARLVRIRMESPRAPRALAGFLTALGSMTDIDASPLADSAPPEEIYAREQAVVTSYRVVPLLWLPQVYGLSRRVRDWRMPETAENWPLADVWLEGGGP